MTESLFGCIARHGTSPGRDPREDRLTEVLAAVFDSPHAKGLACHVGSHWLTGDETANTRGGDRLQRLGALLRAGQAEWTCSARTQRVIRTDNDRRRLDLELLFQRQDGGSSRSERILLWIEIKHGSEPRDDQLAAYLKLMKARSFKNAAVLLLAPRSDYPSFEVAQMPSEVPRLTWEETGRIISSFATTDPVSHFLVDELVAYLREEALMDPPELTREHLAAFQHYEDGMRALLRVCELAEARVSELWANHEEKGTWPEKRKPRDYWWNYGPDNYEGTISISCPTDWAVSWELLTDSAELLLDGKPGVPVFLVGLAGPAGGIATMAESTRAKLQDAGFRVLPLDETRSTKSEYVYRVQYPNELFSGGDLASEADVLANWITTSFADLEGPTEPPPPSSTARERQLRAQEQLSARLRRRAPNAGE